jgi:hypothetical protein
MRAEIDALRRAQRSAPDYEAEAVYMDLAPTPVRRRAYDDECGISDGAGAPGPLKKDGTPDMRYRVNKDWVAAQGGSSMRRAPAPSRSKAVDSGVVPSRLWESPSGAEVHLKKDGTPDMRYKSSREAVYSSPSPAPAPSYYSPASTYSSPAVHLKKDGTPDMRYKSSREAVYSSPSPAPAPYRPSPSSGGSSRSGGPLKKDGTPDMRYKSNW